MHKKLPGCQSFNFTIQIARQSKTEKLPSYSYEKVKMEPEKQPFEKETSLSTIHFPLQFFSFKQNMFEKSIRWHKVSKHPDLEGIY